MLNLFIINCFLQIIGEAKPFIIEVDTTDIEIIPAPSINSFQVLIDTEKTT